LGCRLQVDSKTLLLTTTKESGKTKLLIHHIKMITMAINLLTGMIRPGRHVEV
jgi:hypothetical protein